MKLLVTSGAKLKNRGFTLIEFLIVIGISFIIAGSVLPNWSRLFLRQQLKTTTTDLISDIRLARDRSIVRLQDSAHGLYFNKDESANWFYLIFVGDDFDSNQIDEYQKVVWPPTVYLDDNWQDQKIIFLAGSGEPVQEYLLTIYHQTEGSIDININRWGAILKN